MHVAPEAPHAGDLPGPIAEGFGEGERRLQAAAPEPGDEDEQLAHVRAALARLLVNSDGGQAVSGTDAQSDLQNWRTEASSLSHSRFLKRSKIRNPIRAEAIAMVKLGTVKMSWIAHQKPLL